MSKERTCLHSGRNEKVWDGMACPHNGGIDMRWRLVALGLEKDIQAADEASDILPQARKLLIDLSDTFFRDYDREVSWGSLAVSVELVLELREMCQIEIARQLNEGKPPQERILSHTVMLNPEGNLRNRIDSYAEKANDILNVAARLARDPDSVTRFHYELIGLAFGYAGTENQKLINALYIYLVNNLYRYEGGNLWCQIDNPDVIHPFPRHIK